MLTEDSGSGFGRDRSKSFSLWNIRALGDRVQSKVFTSLLLQLSIAVFVATALIGLEFFSKGERKAAKRHQDAVAIALVEFHKNQCYFISAIQIALLVLLHQAFIRWDINKFIAPIFDVLLSVPLALNGLVPTVFTLCCISRYGRLSWYGIILTVITAVLSTGSLVASYRFTRTEAGSLDEIMGDQSLAAQSRIVCGSDSGNLGTQAELSTIKFSWVWLIYVNCVLWGLYCIVKHVIEPTRGESSRWNRLSRFLTKPYVPTFTYTFFAITWILSFTYHFWLYNFLNKNSLVSQTWTFGQIIAVVVWAPSIVEFLYVEISKLRSKAVYRFLYILADKSALEGPEEASKYKYPPGLRVFRSLSGMSTGLANLELRERGSFSDEVQEMMK